MALSMSPLTPCRRPTQQRTGQRDVVRLMTLLSLFLKNSFIPVFVLSSLNCGRYVPAGSRGNRMHLERCCCVKILQVGSRAIFLVTSSAWIWSRLRCKLFLSRSVGVCLGFVPVSVALSLLARLKRNLSQAHRDFWCE